MDAEEETKQLRGIGFRAVPDGDAIAQMSGSDDRSNSFVLQIDHVDGSTNQHNVSCCAVAKFRCCA